jgi:hypothetical protein
VNGLQFARQLAALREHLHWAACQDDHPYTAEAVPAAASYLRLLDRLADIDGTAAEAITAAVADAAGVYGQVTGRIRQNEDARRQRAAAGRAEAQRRHQIALVIGCAACDAVAGEDCRTIGPKQRPKGIEVHAARYRAALTVGEAGEQQPEGP